MSGTGGFVTRWCAVQDLEPGDRYRFGLDGDPLNEREVLQLAQRTPMGGALLDVRKDDGNVVRSHMQGRVFIVRPRYAG